MSATLLGTVERSKNITSSNAGGRPAPQPALLRRGVRSRRRVRRRLLRLGRLGERHAGHAVDGAQAGQQRGDLRLAGRAALSAIGRRVDRAADRRCRRRRRTARDRAVERRERDVGRDGARDVAQRLLPVEAGGGEVLDGLDARLGHRLEVGVGLQLGGALGAASAPGRSTASSSAWRSLTALVGQHVGGERDHADGERAEHHEGADAAGLLSRRPRPWRAGRLGVAAEVGGKQVDGLHLAWLIGTASDAP